MPHVGLCSTANFVLHGRTYMISTSESVTGHCSDRTNSTLWMGIGVHSDTVWIVM